MARKKVQSYTRKGPGGRSVTVREHKRSGVTPGAAWRSVQRGWKHNRRGNYGRAAAWTALGVGTFAIWASFSGASRFLLLTALVAGGLSVALARATGKET